MAKIKFGAIVSDVRGSIDSVTYARSRYGAYARKKVTPVNPNTVAQSLARAVFGAASSLFRSLGTAVIDQWNAVAPEYQRSNVFGDNLPLSGQTLFTKLKTQLNSVGVTGNPSPISPLTIPNATAGTMIADVSVPAMEIDDVAATGANQVIQFAASAPVSAGKTFFSKSQMRNIHVKPASTAVDVIDLYPSYSNVFGSVLISANIGLKIRFSYRFVSTLNGQSGPWTNQDVIIVA
jgi:hypothetical protein